MLRRDDDVWEADFRALRKPMTLVETHYLGLVVAKADVRLLAELSVQHTPLVNDLARLLADALRRPHYCELAKILEKEQRAALA